MNHPPTGFTSVSTGGLLEALKNRCSLSFAFDPGTDDLPQPDQIHEFDAIWDTGATNSVISQAAIDRVGLIATGLVQVHGVHGASTSESFLVSLFLPNRVAFPSLRVTKGVLGNADILIGMDVISRGDFAVTNFQGVTKFSFRMPSQGSIDFVDEINRGNKRRGQSKRKASHRRAGR